MFPRMMVSWARMDFCCHRVPLTANSKQLGKACLPLLLLESRAV
jgi:hypothetical protein